MKRICAALLLVVLMAGAAWGKEKPISRMTDGQLLLFAEIFSKTEKFNTWNTKVSSYHTEGDALVVIYSHSKNITSFIEYYKDTKQVKKILFAVEYDKGPKGKDSDEKAMLRFLTQAEEAMSFAFAVVFTDHDLKKEFYENLKSQVGPQNPQVFEGVVKVSYQDVGLEVRGRVDKKEGSYILYIANIKK